MSESTFLLAVAVVLALSVAFLALVLGLLVFEAWRAAREVRMLISGMRGAGKEAARRLAALGEDIRSRGSRVGALVEDAARTAAEKVARRRGSGTKERQKEDRP